MILQYNMLFKKLRKNNTANLKEKNLLCEEFLGSLACDSEHDSFVILTFLAFLRLGIRLKRVLIKT